MSMKIEKEVHSLTLRPESRQITSKPFCITVWVMYAVLFLDNISNDSAGPLETQMLKVAMLGEINTNEPLIIRPISYCTMLVPAVHAVKFVSTTTLLLVTGTNWAPPALQVSDDSATANKWRLEEPSGIIDTRMNVLGIGSYELPAESDRVTFMEGTLRPGVTLTLLGIESTAACAVRPELFTEKVAL